MTPVTTILVHGDTQDVLGTWPACLAGRGGPKFGRMDACVSDPPYAVSLDTSDDSERAAWDSWKTPDDFKKWVTKWATNFLPHKQHVVRPGGWVLAFSGEQTFDLTQGGIRDAGLDVIGMGVWLYATGQVKNKNIIRPALEPITFARMPPDQPLTKLFKERGVGLMHTAEAAKIEGKHPVNVFVEGALQDLTIEGDDEREAQELLAKWNFFPCSKPNPKERDFGCESLEIKKKDGNLSGATVTCLDCGHKANRMSGTKLCDGCGSRNTTEKGSISGASGLARNIHPTVKPIDLMRRLVRLVTQPGSWVIDPFMGSGTTGIACVLEGRNFIGIEREKDFHEIAELRVKAAHDLVAKLGRTLTPSETFAEVAFK